MKKKHILTITIECESVDAASDILQKIKAATSLENAEVELGPGSAKTPERVIEKHFYPWDRPWDYPHIYRRYETTISSGSAGSNDYHWTTTTAPTNATWTNLTNTFSASLESPDN